MRHSSNVSEQEGMMLHFTDGSIQACNTNAERILGVSAEQMQGWISLDQSWRSLAVDGSPIPGKMHPAMVALRTGKPCLSVVMGVYRPNTDDLIWLSVNSQPLFRANETSAYAAVTTFFDITEQKLREHQLDVSSTLSVQNQEQSTIEMLNERFALAAAAVNCLIYDWDLESNKVERICGTEILGYQPESAEPTAQWWQERVHPEDLQKINESEVWEYIAQNERVSHEYRVRHKDGHYLWVQDRQIVVKNDAGRPIRIVGSTTDISDRKRIEESLNTNIAILSAVNEATTTLIFAKDRQGRILMANPAVIRLIGKPEAEIINHTDLDYFSDPLEAELIMENDRLVMETGQVEVFEEKIQVAEGIRTYLSTKSPYRDQQGNIIGLIGVSTEITERKQAELNRQESEERLRLAISGAKLGMWFWYLPTNELIWTDKCKELFGIALDAQISYEAFLNSLHPDDRERTQYEVIRSQKEKIDYDIEYRVVWPDASVHWIAAKAKCFYDVQGNAIKMMGTAQDITATKQAEESLRRSEELNRRILNSSYDCIKVLDLSGRLLYLNAGGQELMEIDDLATCINTNWLDFWQDLDRQNAKNAIATAKAGGIGKFQGYSPTAKGTPKWWEVIVTSIPDASGQAEKLLSISRDITERKLAESEREQILARLQQYASQLQGLTEAFLAINAALSVEEVLQLVTQQGRLIIGVHMAIASTTVNQNWAQAAHSISLSDKYAAWRDYSEQLDGSGIYSEVCQTNRPMLMTQTELEAHPRLGMGGESAGKRPPLRGLLVAPLVGQDGRNMGLIQLSDKYEGEFTEEDLAIAVQLAQMASIAIENVRLYEAQLNARSQAEAANRVKDEFLAILSHELRSPLNPILGWTQLLQTYQLDQEKINQAIITIERNAKLLTQLIDDLLDIARILRGKLALNITPLNLELAIEAAIETVSTAATAKSISIETNLLPVGRVRGDFARLQQIIWNLLTNAIKFTPDGGKVEIELKQIGDRAQISVSDTGKGIEPEFLPHVFEYFRQADASVTRNYGGLGLGLAIVRHLVELHGGEVAVTSPGVGAGAIFTVQLPLLQESINKIEAAETEEELEPNLPSIKGIKILVVDDDLDNREFLATMLSQCQAEVMAVASAMEVSAVLRTFKPDILVSDIGMPGIDGYTLLRSIRSLSPEQGGQIPAIAVTAYARAEERQKALESGFQRHLSKPIEARELVKAIAELLSHLTFKQD